MRIMQLVADWLDWGGVWQAASGRRRLAAVQRMFVTNNDPQRNTFWLNIWIYLSITYIIYNIINTAP